MNYNRVILAGNLTREPELSYMPSQTAVVNFGLAVNRRWKSKGGEEKSETCFVECVAFGRTAENINKYVTKGDPLFIEGRLTFETWTAQDNSKRSKHKVTVENFQFLKQAQPSNKPDTAGIDPAEEAAKPQEGEQPDKPYLDDDDSIPF